MIGEIVYQSQNVIMVYSQMKMMLKDVNAELKKNVYYVIQHPVYVWAVTQIMDIMLKVMIQMIMLNVMILNLMVII